MMCSVDDLSADCDSSCPQDSQAMDAGELFGPFAKDLKMLAGVVVDFLKAPESAKSMED